MNNTFPSILWCVVLCAASLVGGCQDPVLDMRYDPPVRTGVLADERITESSGVACSRRHDGVLWTHNDSGNPPHLHALDEKGQSRGAFTVTGAENIDWEDMAAYVADGEAYLLIADVGDNAAARDACRLYAAGEPDLPADASADDLSAPVVWEMTFRYPDGPRDCEAVAVDPHTAEIVLVSKAVAIAKVYVLPLDGAGEEVLVAECIGEMVLGSVTGMDISPDGRRAILSTYGDAYEFARGPEETWADAFARPARRMALPSRKQGEAICYGRDGWTLYVTSEQLPAPVWKIQAIPPDAPGSP